MQNKYHVAKMQEWRLYSQTYEYKKTLKSAITITQMAKDSGQKYAIFWSGGKDSTVMTHLVKSIWKECEIVSQFDDCDWPETKPYIVSVATKLDWFVHEVYPNFSVWEYVQKKCKLGIEDLCAKTHRLTQEAFLKPLDEVKQQLGCTGSFLGLRRLESNARKKNYKFHGHTYTTKSGETICMPLIHFDAKDVFAYLVSNDIEINPCYLQNRFKSPEEIRLTWALPTVMGIGTGDLEHMRMYYPDHFRKFRDMGLV